jgi:hypothetical protein
MHYAIEISKTRARISEKELFKRCTHFFAFSRFLRIVLLFKYCFCNHPNQIYNMECAAVYVTIWSQVNRTIFFEDWGGDVTFPG